MRRYVDIEDEPRQTVYLTCDMQIKTLTSELLSEAKQAGRDSQKPDGRSAFNVPLELRQAKVAGVMEMLDREYVGRSTGGFLQAHG